MSARLRLKRGEERRLLAGHLWVYSNEVDMAATPLGGFEPGQGVILESSLGKPLGVGYVNPHSLICARLLSRDPAAEIGPAWFEARLRRADALRRRCYGMPYYRLAYGESDGLPGLIVDRLGETLAVQTNTAGMERRRNEIVTALKQVLAPAAILFKNTSSLRALEGLSPEVEMAHGALTGPVRIQENNALFWADPVEGQKTGWFYDHRDNRARCNGWVQGARVLDLFSYTGAWSIQALVAGAREAHLVDSSESALALAEDNAALNGVRQRLHTQRCDVFEFLRQARDDGAHYDVVVLDPPALIKRRKDAATGLEAYRRLNQLAMALLSPGGLLVSCSCSHHLPRETLKGLLGRIGGNQEPPLRIVAQGGQGADHPVHPAIPETEYLKALYGWRDAGV